MRIRDRILKDAVTVARKPQNDLAFNELLQGPKTRQRIAEILRLYDAGYGDAAKIAAKVGNCTNPIELERDCGQLVHSLSFCSDGPRQTLYERTESNFARWVEFVEATIETHRGESSDD